MDSNVIVHTDHKTLKKFIEAVTANSRVNDWSFQIHAICKSITFRHIKGSANVLVDSLSRLKYYDLYELPTPEKPGYEFNKPKVEHESLMPQPPGSTYDEVDDLSLFSLLLDPHSPATEEVSELQNHLKTKLPLKKLKEAQSVEFTNIFKSIKKYGDWLAHLYIVNMDGLLYRIKRDNNLKHKAIMVPKELTKMILFEAHEILTHPGQLKMCMFIRHRYFWKNLRKDVNQYVKNCEACNKSNCREPKYANFTTSIPK